MPMRCPLKTSLLDPCLHLQPLLALSSSLSPYLSFYLPDYLVSSSLHFRVALLAISSSTLL